MKVRNYQKTLAALLLPISEYSMIFCKSPGRVIFLDEFE